MKFMNKNKKGFTLVELMIVVVIMAIFFPSIFFDKDSDDTPAE